MNTNIHPSPPKIGLIQNYDSSMTKLIYVLLSITIFATSETGAQTIPLQKGEQIQDLAFNNIVNYHKKKARLSEFKSELIILDFWHRWCSSCIDAFPKLEALQQKYKKKIKIIPITKDSNSEFQSLRSRSKIIQSSSLPFVLEDSISSMLFPHTAVPFYVWLKGDGTFLSTSWETSVNEKNISNFLNGNKLTVYAPNNHEKPAEDIFSSTPKQHNSIRYFSNIKKTNSFGIYRLFTFDSLGHSKNYGFFDGGNTLIDLFCLAFNTKKQNVLPKSQRLKSILPPSDDNNLDEWYQANLYTYEIRLDTSNILFDYNTIFECARKDLQSYFGINAEKKDTLRDCYILSIFEPNLLPKSRTESYSAEKTLNGLYLKNAPIKALITHLSSFLNKTIDQALPILDETNIQYTFDIELDFAKSNFDAINTSLRQFGLELKKTKRVLEALILR